MSRVPDCFNLIALCLGHICVELQLFSTYMNMLIALQLPAASAAMICQVAL